MVGWDNEITVQCDGVADEPEGPELDRLKSVYFSIYPDGKDRESWNGVTYFRVKPAWVRYSDFNPEGEIAEFGPRDLA